MSKLELILLGRFECLLSSGTRVTLAMRKAEILLAFLALAPGLRHPRERLINLLWSDRGEEQARNSLRQCLSGIRKSLGEAADLVLQIDRTTVCLNAELIDVDVHEFERLAGAGDYESLLTAADLYQGEFLEGIAVRDAAGQEWLDSERNRFKRQFVEILYNLAETQLVSHDYGHAIRSAERLVEQDSLGEAGWRLLMQSYADNGDRSHALQAFKRCAQMLRNELDVDPEAATVELRDAIAGGKTDRPAAKPAPAAPATTAVKPASAPAAGDAHSIAVLPFDNLSGNPDQEYLSDGITDSIIMNLALFPDLRVKSRNSSFAFKEQLKGLAEISRELGVDYIVEGSVRRASGRIRVNVQLIEAASSDQVWGKRYDAELDDLFDLEEDLSRSIAATVTGKIESELQRIALAKGASDQQAYDLLLAGIYHLQRGNRKDNTIAIEKLNACLERDPDNARAHAGLYDCHHFSIMDRWSEDLDQSRQLAIKHIQRAVELEPGHKTVLLSYIDYLTFQHRYEEAEVQVQRALANNPSEAGAYAARAVNLSSMGQWPEAVEAAEIALRLDPHNFWGLWILAESLFFCDRYEACLDTIARTDNAPGFILVYNIAANIELGRPDAARKSLDAFVDFCRENMRTPPRSTGEWRQYLMDNAPFADSSANERVLNLLLEAGLEGRMRAGAVSESVDKDRTSAIAVLPFDNLSGDPEQEYFSDGITESIILNLAMFPGLQVKSRNSSFAFKQQLKGLSEISRELEVDYIVEGSIRKSKGHVRITAQLIDAASGNQVWGKRYDAELEDLFDLEEQLSRSIAATVTGRIESELQRIAITKGAVDQQAYDLLLAGTWHAHLFTAKDTQIAIDLLNRCIEQDPDSTRAHKQLYSCHLMNYLGRWSQDYEASFELAADHIGKAIALAPRSDMAQVFYAQYLVFRGEFEQAETYLDKALATNPNNPDALTTLALNLEMQGNFDASLEAAKRSCELDPYHPWAEWEVAVSLFLAGEYQVVNDTISKMRTSPGFIRIFGIAAQVRLGKIDAARRELQGFLQDCRENMRAMPQSTDEWLRYTRENYPFSNPQTNHDIVESLLQAGLDEHLAPPPAIDEHDSLPSILVLPFANISGEPEQEYFSDGISTSIILSLGRFDGIIVKSQKTSFAFKSSELSSVDIAARVGADFLVEGSIRKSAQRVRLSVQLIDAESGSQIWGQQYDEELQDIFELEQQLSQGLAATISGRLGHRIQQSAVRKPAKDLKSYDHLMRGLYHFGKFTTDDFEIAKREIGKCLEIDPDNVKAHANLGMIHHVEVGEGWSRDRTRSEQLARQHLETAIDVDPDNSLAHAYLAEFLLSRGEFERSEFHADKAIELNPNDPDGYMVKAEVLGCTRRVAEALPYADRCIALDPHSIGAGWVAGATYQRAGQYQKAIKTLRSISHPPTSIHARIATCLIGLGLTREARNEMQRYQALARRQMTAYPQSEEAWRAHWRFYEVYQHEEDFDAMFEQLLAAGLCEESAEAIEDIPSIAVLPFDNMSGDPEQEHFADGITTDIVAILSKFGHLRTVSRYSTLQYKNHKAPIAEIAAQQGVRYILEGSVRKSGARIRVSAELIDSADGQILWNERYDRDLDDLFAVQDEITRNIAIAMKVRFDDGEMASYRSAGTSNIRAWELTLIAAELQDTYIYSKILESRKMVQEAIRLDANYAFAWVVLAWTYFQETFAGWCASFEEAIAAADTANRRALEIDPDYGEAWSQASTIAQMKHEPDQALEACRKAVEIEPGNAEIQILMALALQYAGAYDEARKHCNEVKRLCPVQPNWYYLPPGHIEMQTGNSRKAIAIYRQGVAAEPESPLCRFFLVDALIAQGDEAGARACADEIRALDDSVRGRGLVRAYSADEKLSQRLRANLEKFDLY